jgi:very-short-patch-repair endonuclease
MVDKRYVHGLVTARELGLSRAAIAKRVRSGTLFRHYRGVYSPLPELTREGEWLAAVLAAGEGAALASLNAAALREISRFRPDGITVAVPTRRRSQGFKLIVGLDARDVRVRNGIPVTSVERVFIDAARELWPEQLANLLHEAAFRKCLSIAALRRTMARTTTKRMGRLARAIEMHLAGSVGTRSNLEDRFMALVRQARLPMPVINTRIHGIEVDFRWGDYCVEVDGPNHQRPATRSRDAADEAVLRGRGFVVMRFTEAAIDREPHEVLRELAAQQLARRVARQ